MEDDSLYSDLHSRGYEVGPTAERLFSRPMTVAVFDGMNYILGNDSSTAPLMYAVN